MKAQTKTVSTATTCRVFGPAQAMCTVCGDVFRAAHIVGKQCYCLKHCPVHKGKKTK